jgi:hypothetical protein
VLKDQKNVGAAVWRSSGRSLAGGNTFGCMRRCMRNCDSILYDEIEVGERAVGRGEGWTLRFYAPLDEV